MKNEKFKNYLLIETNYHVLFRTNCHLTTFGLKYTENLSGSRALQNTWSVSDFLFLYSK